MSVFKPIAPEDQTITPFKVYKSWGYTGTASNKYLDLTSQSIFLLSAIQPTPSNFSDGQMPIDFHEETDLDLSTKILNSTYKFLPAGIVWHSLKHQYFNDYNGQINFGGLAKPAINKTDNLELWSGTTFKSDVHDTIKSYNYISHILNPSSSCELQSNATVISIPQSKFGEEIKPGSLSITWNSNDAGTVVLTDDGNNNLVDTNISGSFKLNNRLLRLGFDTNSIICDPRYPVEITTHNTFITASFLTSSLSSPAIPYGNSMYFSQGYVRIDGTPSYFNPRTLDNYAISFWFKIDDVTPNHGKNSHLITKRSLTRNYQLIKTSGRSTSGNIWQPNNSLTPYDIYITQAGTLTALVGDGFTLKTLTYGTSINDGDQAHVVFQKSGSVYQLWVNGNLEDSENINLTSIKNNADIFIGCKGIDTRTNTLNGTFNGSIDEVQFYNTYLTSSEIAQLSTVGNNNTNSHNVGKVFYKDGIIVITSPDPKYGSTNAGDTSQLLLQDSLYDNSIGSYVTPSNTLKASTISIAWNSTLTLYENEILCRINEDEYNFTLNPSILKDSENGQLPKEFIYNDEFGPYITTVGLYNENAELLAIGKLAGPIKKRSNVDLNIIVRFDQ